MTRNATICFVRITSFAFAGMLALGSVPAAAQQTDVTDNRVTVEDVAMTPLEDLNLAKDPIPPALLRARADIYENPGYSSCSELRQPIADLDAVLGEDYDTATPEEREMSAEKIAKQVVGSLIPFRGIIRELTGANKHAYEFSQAIIAGLSRRAYLKGLGQEMGCAYPIRPAENRPVAAVPDEEDGDEEGTVFYSTPVVQQTPRN